MRPLRTTRASRVWEGGLHLRAGEQRRSDGSSPSLTLQSHPEKGGFFSSRSTRYPQHRARFWTTGWRYSLSSGTLTLCGQPERLRWWGYSPVTCPVPSHPGMGHLVSLFSGLGESAEKSDKVFCLVFAPVCTQAECSSVLYLRCNSYTKFQQRCLRCKHPFSFHSMSFKQWLPPPNMPFMS